MSIQTTLVHPASGLDLASPHGGDGKAIRPEALSHRRRVAHRFLPPSDAGRSTTPAA